MVQKYSIEVVFENGKPKEPLGDPYGIPTLREIIESSSESSKTATAHGTEHMKRLNDELIERQASGRVHYEEIGRPAVEAIVQSSTL